MNPQTYTNRYEIKYLVRADKLPQIETGLRDFLVPDSNCGQSAGYFNHSVYFDSTDYRFYSEKREGNLARIKPRIRMYKDAPDAAPSAIFLELKGRYNRIVTKRRAPIGNDFAEYLLSSGPPTPNGHALEGSAVGEFYYLAHRFRLSPCVSVLYHRKPFSGAFYPNVRVTFDRMIQCSRVTALESSSEVFISAVPANWLVIELKYNNKVPQLLLRRFNSLGLQQATISKFAVALERTHDQIFMPGRIAA